ncbi:MAG: FKBP-type peptidyl-prolyl cis-trans isomerase, partial [Firmicutes bacterium]|nr:FKBP-type peptidyl-prolyl cis-trans isomerase [Bacillota bacterium]
MTHLLQGSKKAATSLAAIFLTAALLFTGCGSSGKEPYDYDLSKYIKPADYIGVTYGKLDTEVTSDDIKAEIDKRRENDAETETVETGTVASGDAIRIDYVGTIDGVEFEGGNSKNMGVDIVVGKANYIEGFEAGLVGAEVGSTVVLDLRFPDDYGSAELAGKNCQFTV